MAIKNFFEKRQSAFFEELVFDWGVIAFCLALMGYFSSICATIALMPLLVNRQYALPIVGHEGVHFSISENKKWNDFVAQLFCFLPICGNLYSYRRFHIAHHVHVNTNKDPEFNHLCHFQQEWATPIKAKSILKFVLKDIFLLRSLVNIFWVIRISGPKNAREILPILIFHSITHTALYLCGMSWLSLVWIISLLTFFWPFFRLRIWIEHKATPNTHRIHLNWFWQFLIAPHNIWVHYEHHKAAAVPFYNLIKFRKYLDADLPIMTFEEFLKYLAQTKSELPAIESLLQIK